MNYSYNKPPFHLSVSVGICAFNEEANIGNLLKNLLHHQPLDENFQLNKIIVVASGCTDNTPKIVKEFCSYDDRIALITEKERKGKVSALNIILREATRASDLLVLVNADNIPSPNNLNKLVELFRDKSVGAVGSRPVPVNTSQNVPSLIARLIWDLHHRVSMYKSVKLSGELCAIRPWLVKEMPINLATDEPYMEAFIRNQGYKIIYAPDVITYMKGPNGFRELLKQRRRIWTGHLQIKKMTGFSVSTSDPKYTFPVLIGYLRSHNKDFMKTFTAVLLEICAYMLARYDLSRGKVPYIWERLGTTKTLQL